MARDRRRRRERRWRRFVISTMRIPFTAPALGGAVLAAVALGIHLGESSIGLINPIYFQGPAVHPRDRGAAIDEDAVRPRPASYGQLYGWADGRAADCGDCDALAARDAYAQPAVYSARVPYFGSREELRAEDVRARVTTRVAYGEEEEFAAAQFVTEEVVEPKSPVLRYASYPIEEVAEEPEPEFVPPDEPDAGKFYE